MEDDVTLLSNGDVVYVALQGEHFNNCAILDEYELGQVLGVGGFGKVYLGKHKESKS